MNISYIPASSWLAERERYQKAIYKYTSSFRDRRARGKAHPIYDFLFTYYTFSTRKLEVWHPGLGVALEPTSCSATDRLLADRRYKLESGAIVLSRDSVRERELRQLESIRELSLAIIDRTPRFSCLGLHEWAMVYRTDDIRHDYPLRVTSEEIARFLESRPVVCSHFDAFRFFSSAATRLNVLQPTSDSRLQLEQSGCIHANMDLYKWAFKLVPLVPSNLVLRCFELACEAREIDMRASPYDFSALGFHPIRIEEESGQNEYRALQRSISERAQDLRAELIRLIEQIQSMVSVRTTIFEQTIAQL